MPRMTATSVRRRRDDAAMVVAGTAILVIAMIVVRHDTVASWERSVFRAINDLPRGLYTVLWPFQQLGALGMGVVVVVVTAVLGRRRLAVGAAIVTVMKLVAERIVKVIVSRQRPGTSIGPNVHRRGNVSLGGESFVSGHAVLITALAGIVMPYLRGRWKVVPAVLVLAVMVTRVYVGAHNPLDVVGGFGLGLAIAGAVNLALGVPTPTEGADR